ncbi:hypothetical protein [Ferrimicrobium sp.]
MNRQLVALCRRGGIPLSPSPVKIPREIAQDRGCWFTPTGAIVGLDMGVVYTTTLSTGQLVNLLELL